MGVLEKSAARNRRRNKIVEIILKTVTAAGILSVALLPPNALQFLRCLKTEDADKIKSIIFKTAAARLAKQGLVEFNKTERGTFLRLTPAGEKKLRLLELDNFEIPKPKRWDKRWRVVIFDIKEVRRGDAR